MPAPEKDTSLWVTRKQAAELCGVSSRTFDDAVKPLIDAASVRGGRTNLQYHGPGVVKALLAYRMPKKGAAGADADPLLTADTNYRRLKIELAEMEVQERRGELVKKEAFKRAIAGGFIAFRGTGDQIARRHGNDAADLFNEGLTEFETVTLAALNAHL